MEVSAGQEWFKCQENNQKMVSADGHITVCAKSEENGGKAGIEGRHLPHVWRLGAAGQTLALEVKSDTAALLPCLRV